MLGESEGFHQLDQATQHKLRVLAPGLVSAALLAPLVLGGHFAQAFSGTLIPELQLLVLVVVLGAAYNLSGVRDTFVAPVWAVGNQAVTDRLVALVDTDLVERSKLEALRSNPKVLKHAFYYFVDSDPTLTIISGRVRLWGVYVTTIIDAGVLALLFSAPYLFVGLLKGAVCFALASPLLLLAAALLMFGLLPAAHRRHMEYQLDQMEHIEIHYAAGAREMLQRMACE